MHKAGEVSEVRLVGDIDDEVSEVDYDEDCEVRQANELDIISKLESQCSRLSEPDELR